MSATHPIDRPPATRRRRTRTATPGQVAVLAHDPELGAGLRPEDLAAARRRAVARTLTAARGRWDGVPTASAQEGSLGLLVLEGLLVRKVIADGPKAGAELLGSGDVLQPWRQVGSDSSVNVDVEWEVVEPLVVAVLDREFALRVAPWPSIAATLAGRIMTRAHWLAFQLAVCQVRRIDERVLLLLWHLADRWGRVTPRGVELTVTLPHSLLASLVAARRPAVSLALQSLVETGQVQRRARSRWTLHGQPPTFGRSEVWSPRATPILAEGAGDGAVPDDGRWLTVTGMGPADERMRPAATADDPPCAGRPPRPVIDLHDRDAPSRIDVRRR